MGATVSWLVRRFARSELLVMQGLLEDADRTDKDIAELYGLKKSTVASARRRLVESGTIRYALIPAFSRLGCEMIGYHVGTAGLSVSLEKRAGQYVDFTRKAPQIFFGILGPNVAVFFTALRNATEHEKFIHSYNRFFSGSMRGYRAPLRSEMFPYAISWGTFNFNFAPLVHAHFNVDGRPPKVRIPVKQKPEEPDMTSSGKRVFVELIEGPSRSDERISGAVGISRQGVTKMRHSFTEKGLMSPVWIPDFRSLGFEIYACIRSRVRDEIPWDVVDEKSEPKEVLHLAFFTLAKMDGAIASYAHPDFHSYSELSEKALGVFETLRILDSEPEVILLSLTHATMLRFMDFAPATRHLLLASSKG